MGGAVVVGEGGEQAGEFGPLGRVEGGEEFVLRLTDERVEPFQQSASPRPLRTATMSLRWMPVRRLSPP
ncbi:hypothetical protein [Streptomyces werraensis]|uniref:hypothetical protein n=1 Tax=Streptomyces werraensis TaxID=68284 RepID=UPI0036AB931F